MAEIKVTPAVLRQKSEELQTGVKNLAQKMNELQERENSLSGMWQGAAKDSFHNAFTMNASHFFRSCKDLL